MYNLSDDQRKRSFGRIVIDNSVVVLHSSVTAYRIYRETFDISRPRVGNKLVDPTDVGDAPSTPGWSPI